MHRQFRKLLEKATGSAEFVIAINVDIRGFSSFSKTVESTEVAVFIKKVYMKLIDNYFTNASFFKSTGDGLLIIIPYTEGNLEEVAVSTIKNCLQILEDFGNLCAKDPMINFRVPQKVGIGLSRGSACYLLSGKKMLDYSGSVLNTASRLMDFARPSGIVFDANFGIELLPDELKTLFAKESVYIKSIAERTPLDIYYTKDYSRISPLAKHPIAETKWRSINDKKTLKQIRDSAHYLYYLPSRPIDPNQIVVKISHPKVVRGRKRKGMSTKYSFSNFQYSLEGKKPCVSLACSALVNILEKAGVKDTFTVNIEIIYPET
jgi:class 3 adenylate cyclase